MTHPYPLNRLCRSLSENVVNGPLDCGKPKNGLSLTKGRDTAVHLSFRPVAMGLMPMLGL